MVSGAALDVVGILNKYFYKSKTHLFTVLLTSCLTSRLGILASRVKKQNKTHTQQNATNTLNSVLFAKQIKIKIKKHLAGWRD